MRNRTIIPKRTDDYADAKEDINGRFQQLCWNCKRVLDASCSWCAKLEPVEFWDATPVKNSSEMKKSFAIFHCPKFIPIHKGVKKCCAQCGAEFVSYGNICCSYECYKGYEQIYGKAYGGFTCEGKASESKTDKKKKSKKTLKKDEVLAG